MQIGKKTTVEHGCRLVDDYRVLTINNKGTYGNMGF